MDTTFDDFQATALAKGFDEVLVREWQPGQQVPTHAHPFDVQALVVRGEFALTAGGHTRRIVGAAGSSWRAMRPTPSTTVPKAPRSGWHGGTRAELPASGAPLREAAAG